MRHHSSGKTRYSSSMSGRSDRDTLRCPIGRGPKIHTNGYRATYLDRTYSREESDEAHPFTRPMVLTDTACVRDNFDKSDRLTRFVALSDLHLSISKLQENLSNLITALLIERGATAGRAKRKGGRHLSTDDHRVWRGPSRSPQQEMCISTRTSASILIPYLHTAIDN